MKITEKEKVRVQEIVAKALDSDQGALTEGEVNELQSLLKKAQVEKEELAKEGKEQEPFFSENFEEAVSRAASKVFGNLEEKLKKEEAEKNKSPKEKIEELKRFYKEEGAKLEKRIAETKKRNQERQFYEDYYKKYGNGSL